MNFDDAIKAHAAWKLRLTMLNDGNSKEKLDPSVVERDNVCELGKWLTGEGLTRFKGMPEFEEIVALHARFHKAAAEVIKRVATGRKYAGSELSDSEYGKLSSQIIQKLMKMKHLTGT